MNSLLRRTALASLIALLALAATGCAAKRSPVSHDQAITADATRRVTIVHADGSPASWQDVVVAASSADAILIGENHGHPLGLAAASKLWQDVLAQSPHAALALEFFERDEQSRLDEYLSGVTDEPTFRKRCARNDSSYPPGHRAMVEAAKTAHRPVIAANAPRPYVHLARTEGYERLAALSPNQRSLFRIPDELPARDSHYRKAFDEVMEGFGDKPHGAAAPAPPPDPAVALERSQQHDNGFRAQSLWDWTMADSVARSINDGNTPTLLVVGRFHVDHHGGLPTALDHLRPGTKTTTISFADEPPPPSLPEIDRARADFIIYVGKSN